MPPSETLSCSQVSEQLEALIDGDLGPDPRDDAAAEAHLESCPDCAAEYALAVAIRRELRALPELDVPATVLQTVLQDGARPSHKTVALPPRQRRSRWIRPQRLAAAAILAASIIGAGWWVHSLQPEPPPTLATIDPESLAKATDEARYALAYLARVNRRAGLKLQQDLLIERLAIPAARTLSRSLSTKQGTDGGDSDAEERNRS